MKASYAGKKKIGLSEIVMTDEIEYEIGMVVSFNNLAVNFYNNNPKFGRTFDLEEAYIIINKTLTPCPSSRDRSFEFYYYVYDICKTNDPNGVFKGVYSTHLYALNT